MAYQTAAGSAGDEGSTVVERFKSLDRRSRVELMCELYGHCTHREQVEILERLPGFLLRDFIALLPPELVEKILCYFEGRDIFTCMLVSKAWYRTITHCEKYWKTYCRRIGLTRQMVMEGRAKYDSLRDLAIVGQKARKKVKRSMPQFRFYFPDVDPPESVSTLTLRPAEPTRHGYFIGHDVHSDETGSQYFLSIRKLRDHETIVELIAVEVSSYLVIHWCSSTPSSVTVYGSTGEWIHCTFDQEERATVDKISDEIYSLAFYEIGSCPKCSTIVVLPRSPREESLWDIEVVKLIPGQPKPEKLSCVLPFLPDDSLRGNVFFQTRKVAVLPTASEACDQHGHCCEHKVLFMFGGGLVLCALSLHEGKASLEQLRTYCPHNINFYGSAAALGQKLCISEDHKLAGYYIQGILHVWNMETGEERRLVNFRFPKNGYCIGVGYLFSMVYGENIIRVVCSETGAMALIHGLSYTGENPVFSPRHQEWLNTIEFPRSRLEVAITVPDWQSAGEIAFTLPDIGDSFETY